MFKKALCLLLILACSFALFACSGNDTASGGGQKPEGSEQTSSGGKEFVDDKVEVKPSECYSFVNLISSSNPNVISTKETVTNSKLGTIVSNYKTYVMGENEFVFEYLYQRFNLIGEGNMIQTVPASGEVGTVYYKDGSYSVDGENWSAAAPDVDLLNIKFALTKGNIDNAKKLIENSDGSLTIETSPAEAKKILGIDLGASGNVSITISAVSGRLANVNVEFWQGSNTVTIETSFTYEALQKSAE